MTLDKDDLAAICTGMTPGEVDRIHRLLHEWNTGPDDSFPVQLALLTKAQWRIAAGLPNLLADSRKLMESHLADYRRQTKEMLDAFSRTTAQQQAEIKTAVEIGIQTTRQAAEQIQAQLDDAEAVAKHVKALMDSAVSEWRGVKAVTKSQCEQLQQVSHDLQARFAWRIIIWWVAWLSVAFGLGYCLGVNGT